MPISILFWSTLPVAIIALIRSFKTSFCKALGLIARWIVYISATALFVLENYLLSAYKSLYTDSIAVNILATNKDEATGFLEVIPPSYILFPLISAVALLVALNLLIRPLQKKITHWIVEVVYFLPLLLIIPMNMYISKKGESYNFMAPIERLYHGTMDSLRDSKTIAEMLSLLKSKKIGRVKSLDLGKINVVFIMGESLRKDYMHCYGYPVKNTPYIDSLIDKGSMILFSDVIASAPSTASSVKGNMSFHSLESSKEWYEYPTLTSLFSQAGYFTYWVSNQEKQGGFIGPVPAIAETADRTTYIKVRTSTDWRSAYDEEIVPHLMHLNEVTQPLLQVVHLMGSHTAFAQRYPHEYNIYTPEDLPEYTPDGTPRPKGKTEDTNLIQYLNTIIYNDYVIHKIIRAFDNEPTLILYTSDHGLEIHDDPTSPEHCGHADQPMGLRIPLMVYANDEFKAMNPSIWERVLASKDRKIMTDITANSIANLLGIENEYVIDSLSFFSPKYVTNRRRAVDFYNGLVEID